MFANERRGGGFCPPQISIMKQTTREEFIHGLIDDVKQIPVDQVIGEKVELVRRGRSYMGLCPFHPDNHIGSFVVTPDKGLWKCFACGCGGNVISFVKSYYELGFMDALTKLAVDFDLVTPSECEMFLKRKYDPETVMALEKESLRAENDQKTQAADADVKSVVYKSIASVCELKDTHKKHLIEERHISEEELEGPDKEFFSFPTRNMNLPVKVFKNIKALTDDGVYPGEILSRTKKQLPIVPGFFFNEDRTCIDFASNKGVGFLVKDDMGVVQGIQIRKDVVKEGESRYVWFSSAFATTKSGCSGGGCAGAPGGVIKSKTGKAGCVFITEGRFKAEAIAQTGNTAIYVSGVSTWRNVLPILDCVIGNRKKVYLAFDSDMLGNVAVYKQLKSLGDALKQRSLNPMIVLWSKAIGKGFDDFYYNAGENFKEKCCFVRYEEFCKDQDIVIANTLKQFGVDHAKDLDRNKIDSFVEELQNTSEIVWRLEV